MTPVIHRKLLYWKFTAPANSLWRKFFRKAPAEEILVECKGLYRTSKEYSIAIDTKSESLKEEYRESIRTVEDLVRFCLTHKVEYREYCHTEARIISLEKTKELLGISLKAQKIGQ